MSQRRPHETIGPWINAEFVIAVVETIAALTACIAVFGIPCAQAAR